MVDDAGEGVGADGSTTVDDALVVVVFFFGKTGAELKPYLPDRVAKAISKSLDVGLIFDDLRLEELEEEERDLSRRETKKNIL